MKGRSFEREVCNRFGLWWTFGKRDDVFWRTSGSGARAKTRSKKNLKTFGQYGDIQATNPIGQPLIDLCNIEIKRGYSKHTFADLIDKSESAKEQLYEVFINQAKLDSDNSDTCFWLLITKRDRRETLIFMPYDFFAELKTIGCSLTKYPYIFLKFERQGL